MSKPKVLVLGSFDILHYGHLQFIAEAAKLGDVYVALGSDPYQKGYKRPCINTYWERRAALLALPHIKDVVRREKVSITLICAQIDPQYLVTGSDWLNNNQYLSLSGIDKSYLERNDVALVYLPRSHSMSTTKIIERCRDLESL